REVKSKSTAQARLGDWSWLTAGRANLRTRRVWMVHGKRGELDSCFKSQSRTARVARLTHLRRDCMTETKTHSRGELKIVLHFRGKPEELRKIERVVFKVRSVTNNSIA